MFQVEKSNQKISTMVIDDMVLNLLSNCYNFDYADVSGHFYQLALQTSETDPNIIGPLKPPTGESIRTRSGKSFSITKRVECVQEVPVSIWVVRGFYPETSIPFKMQMWKRHEQNWDYGFNVKVLMGTFADKHKYTTVNCPVTYKYIQEVAEKVILSEPLDNIEKPERALQAYKCMSPKGLPLQKRSKNEQNAKTRVKCITKNSKKKRVKK